MRKYKTKFPKMATGRKVPLEMKRAEFVHTMASTPSLPSPLPYLIARRNLNAARPHPLAEGAD